MKQFKFVTYKFDAKTFTAVFIYQGEDGIRFIESVKFAKTDKPIKKDLLDEALFLAFILIGTSYYKAHPTRTIALEHPIDDFQARFFSAVYQDGLSQFAFENQLERKHLAHFDESDCLADILRIETPKLPKDFNGILSTQSGGKDSLLVAKLLEKSGKPHTFWALGTSAHHPEILDRLDAPLQTAVRALDMPALAETDGLRGHVPITYITMSLALIQAILNHNKTVLFGIGQEGNEPATTILSTGGVGKSEGEKEPDLPVNHQWSKTWAAEQLFADYVKKYISPDFQIGSPLRKYTELKIAELFAEHCWGKFGNDFSSCNVANYKQHHNSAKLAWCGKCPKCANSYLLFAPFVAPEKLNALFPNGNLFREPTLADDFKGLLGLENHLKPFECVGEVAELRKAYELRKDQAPENSLPFAVPKSDFDYEAESPAQSLEI